MHSASFDVDHIAGGRYGGENTPDIGVYTSLWVVAEGVVFKGFRLNGCGQRALYGLDARVVFYPLSVEHLFRLAMMVSTH